MEFKRITSAERPERKIVWFCLMYLNCTDQLSSLPLPSPARLWLNLCLGGTLQRVSLMPCSNCTIWQTWGGYRTSARFSLYQVVRLMSVIIHRALKWLWWCALGEGQGRLAAAVGGCAAGWLRASVGVEGGHMLVPPLSVPASVGAAAGVQAWAAIAQGRFCGHRVPQQQRAAAGSQGMLTSAFFCYISLQSCSPFPKFLLAWRRAKPLLAHLLLAVTSGRLRVFWRQHFPFGTCFSSDYFSFPWLIK